MIQVNHLSVSYKSKNKEVKALENINFTADSHDICAIIGPSGCGKSTLLNVLSGIIKEYEGQVLLNGEELNPHLHKIGFIPQNFGLLPWKTVEENCLLSFKIKREKVTNETLNKMNEMMKTLNIDALNKRYPSELSGGQKQRVSMVRSFLMQPDLLLMDEAFSASSMENLTKISSLLKKSIEEDFQILIIEQKNDIFKDLPRREINIAKDAIKESVKILSVTDY